MFIDLFNLVLHPNGFIIETLYNVLPFGSFSCLPFSQDFLIFQKFFGFLQMFVLAVNFRAVLRILSVAWNL